MKKDIAIQVLSKNMPEIKKRFNVDSLSIFGSVARGDSGPESDVDILVDCSKNAWFFFGFDLKEFLEKLLGCPVDMVTTKALKKQLRDGIFKEAARV